MKRVLKAALSAIIVLSMLIPTITVPAFAADDTIPTDGLLFNLTFDEQGADGTSFAATTGGTVTKHGTTALVASVDEESGMAMNISSNAAGNYLELPKGILNGKDAATFSFWIKPDTGWAFMTTPLSGAQDYLNEKYLGMLATSSTFTVERYNNSGSRLSSVITNGTYMDWQYVTVTFTANGTSVYVNGELVGSDNVAVNIKSLMTADASTWIGHGNWGSGEGFSGTIDDFRIYGRALNESEISSLSAKAADRAAQKLLQEKNCIETDTHFYLKGADGNTEIFSVSNTANENYRAEISIRNYTVNTDELTIGIYGIKKDGSEVKLSGDDNSKISLASREGRSVALDFSGSGIPSNVSKIVARIASKVTKKTYDVSSLYCDVVSPQIAPADSAETTFGAHDPSIVKFPNDDTYYVYSSHHLIFTSKDLINWEKHDFTNINASVISPVTSAFITNNYTGTTMNGTYWAPDVIYKEGDSHPYWAYISLSCGLGGRNSAISLMKSTSPLFWADKNADIIDAGIVFATKEVSGYKTNAIDANIYTDTSDNNKQYFVWGSFWQGIQAAPMTADGFVEGIDYTSDATILSSCKNFGTSIFTQKNGVAGPEGAWAIEHGNYRYMFTSYGWLGSNYNTRVARSPMATKFSTNMGSQLVDANNVPMGNRFDKGSLSEPSGYKMIGSYRLGDGNMEITVFNNNYHIARGADEAHIYYGPGHNSAITAENGETFYISHTRKDEVEGAAYLQARKMLWTEDGWPIVSPVTYAGEVEQKLPKDMIVGTYDLASVGRTKMIGSALVSSGSLVNRNYDLPVVSSKVTLNADGTLADNLGTWQFDGNHKITLKFNKDGDTSKDEFYKSGDTMTMYALFGYDKDEQAAVIALTGTDQNHITQFAKKNLTGMFKIKNEVETVPTVIEKSSKGNPILGFDGSGNLMYAGDPAAMVEGDTVYLYAGHDTSTGDSYVMPEWVCYSSKDMETWKYEGVTMKATDVSWRNDNNSAWASQVIKYGSKYYMYYCTWDKTSSGKQSIGVAVSNSPTGPFADKGTPIVKGTLTEPETSGWNDIDPTVWVETVDGVEHRYLAWGNGIFYVCELNEDMISVKDLNGDGQIKMNDDIKQQTFTNLPDGLGFTEAPFIYRRTDENGNYTGKYYMFGAFGWREQMGYVTSDSMYGPWEYGETIMPPTATSNTNHPSVIDFNGKTYFIYHNGSLPYGSGYRRSVCVEELTFNEDGTIGEILETSTGLTGTATAISLSTDPSKLIAHDSFVNPSADASYPIKKPLTIHSTADADAMWEFEAGKADPTNENYVSIQAYNKPGLYITASGMDIILTQYDTINASLANSMTFKTVKGINGTDGAVSFESVAKEGYFLTAENGRLTLTAAADADACSFMIGEGEKTEPVLKIDRTTSKITIQNSSALYQYALYNSAGELVADWTDGGSRIVFDNLSKNTKYEVRVRETANPDNVYSETVTTKNSSSKGSSSSVTVTPKPTVTPTAAPTETTAPIDELDTENHIQFVYGKDDGNFDPNGSITRAEILAMFARLYKGFDMNAVYPTTFSDVRADAWYASTVGFMEDKNLISGYEDNTFKPEATITRAEFARIAARFADATAESSDISFSDVSDGHWAVDYIKTVASNGWLGSADVDTFSPDSMLTRADAVEAICKITDRVIDDSSLQNVSGYIIFPDVTEGSPYYYYIIEAANPHTYEKDEVEKWKALS